MSGRATADLFDTHGDVLRVAAPIFRDFGGVRMFEGPVATVKVFEDNSLVRRALEEPGSSHVLVVDGGGSLRCALVGDMLALLGEKNGWSGLLVYGCIRDAVAIGNVPIGVKALATNPRKSVKNDAGERNVEVQFADIAIRPGDYIYADEDGVVVAESEIP
jgi:regulator of ribonuclease activity A